MSKIVEVSNAPGLYLFMCPGCGYNHHINTRPNEGPVWQFNKDLENPTVSPSLLVWAEDASMRCHSFIKDGKIQFLGDCFHELKNQTVELPEWEHD